MNNLKRWFLILTTSGLVVLLLVSFLTILPALAQGPGGMMGRGSRGGFGPGQGMMGGYGYNNGQPGGYGPGWMMDLTQGLTGTAPSNWGPGWMHGGFGHRGMMGFGPRGMMGGFGSGWAFPQGGEEAGFYGYGCRGAGGGMWSPNSPFLQTESLSLAEATDAVNTFLAELGQENLELGEVMVFDNHAYAQIVESDTGMGAMELLVDPATQTVYPEMGPNMMWNLKYGMMAGFGGPGRGRFGNVPGTRGEVPAEMSVSPEEAVQVAQAYLDANIGSDLTVNEQADPFYGYYTLHVDRDGETMGMLSVNGFTGQVFLHTWHGELLEHSGE